MANIASRTNHTTKKARRARLYYGVQARVARQLRVTRAHVSLVVAGFRRSKRVERALADEVGRVERGAA